jgi:hypothetical protein
MGGGRGDEGDGGGESVCVCEATRRSSNRRTTAVRGFSGSGAANCYGHCFQQSHSQWQVGPERALASSDPTGRGKVGWAVALVRVTWNQMRQKLFGLRALACEPLFINFRSRQSREGLISRTHY